MFIIFYNFIYCYTDFLFIYYIVYLQYVIQSNLLVIFYFTHSTYFSPFLMNIWCSYYLLHFIYKILQPCFVVSFDSLAHTICYSRIFFFFVRVLLSIYSNLFLFNFIFNLFHGCQNTSSLRTWFTYRFVSACLVALNLNKMHDIGMTTLHVVGIDDGMICMSRAWYFLHGSLTIF